MAYKSKARRKQPQLKQPIEGNGIVMTPQIAHNVSIEVKKVESDGVFILFNDSFGNRHQEKIFRLDKEGQSLSYLLKQLLAAVSKDTASLKDTYESLLQENSEKIYKNLEGKKCIIETEYRGDYINIKTIRRIYDKNDSGKSIHPTKNNKPRTTKSKNTTSPQKYIALPKEAESSF